jgi:hypothetical protein
MERETIPTQAYEGATPISGRVRTEWNQGGMDVSGNKTTYWGVLCRSCIELIAFDISPFRSFGAEAASMNPGAIRCAHGHVHIYFPRDYQFFFSDIPLTDAALQANREAYRAANPAMQVSRDDSEEFVEPYAPSDSILEIGACLESLVPDAPRQATDESTAFRPRASSPRTVESRDHSWLAILKGWLA